MPSIDQFIEPNETLELNSDVWNQIVDRLRSVGSPGVFRTSASTQYAEVHYDDQDGDPEQHFKLSPGSVVIQDTTDWRGYDPSLIEIEYTLTGVGHLGAGSLTATSGPNGFVEWKWFNEDEFTNGGLSLSPYTYRDWNALIDNERLPTSVTIQSTAKLTIKETNKPSVSTTTALAAETPNSEGDRRLVSEDGDVYQYTTTGGGDVAASGGGSWNLVSTATEVVHGTTTTHVLVARAYDPTYLKEIQINLEPEAEFFTLGEEGTTEIRIHDNTHFPDDITLVTRSVTVDRLDNSGNSLGTTGLTVTAANPIPPGNPTGLLEIDSTSRIINVSTGVLGNIRVRVDYTITGPSGTDILTVYRMLRAHSPIVKAIPNITPPTIPSITTVTPKDGTTTIRLGVKVKLYSYEKQSGPVFLNSFVNPAQTISSAIASRLETTPETVLSRMGRDRTYTGTVINSPLYNQVTGNRFVTEVTEEDLSLQLSKSDASRILSAVNAIGGILTSRTQQIVNLYEIAIVAGEGEDENTLLSIEPGQALYLGGTTTAVRVVSKLSESLQQIYTVDIEGVETPINGVRLEVEGIIDPEFPNAVEDSNAFNEVLADFSNLTTGYSTGIGDLLLLQATFGYGSDINSDAFPSSSFETRTVIDPKAAFPEVSFALPNTVVPTSAQDGWHVQLNLVSAWMTGVYTGSTTQWLPAENVPQSVFSPLLEAHRYEHVVVRTLQEGTQADHDIAIGDPEDVESEFYKEITDTNWYGYHEWVHNTNESLPDIDTSRVLKSRIPYQGGEKIARPALPATLYLIGHFRTRGGTCGPIQVYLSPGQYRPAPPFVVTKRNLPDDPNGFVPIENQGVLLYDEVTVRAWVALGGQWIRWNTATDIDILHNSVNSMAITLSEALNQITSLARSKVTLAPPTPAPTANVPPTVTHLTEDLVWTIDFPRNNVWEIEELDDGDFLDALTFKILDGTTDVTDEFDPVAFTYYDEDDDFWYPETGLVQAKKHQITWIALPETEQAGSYTIEIYARDSQGASVTKYFGLLINPVGFNSPPIIDPESDPIVFGANATTVKYIELSDPEQDNIGEIRLDGNVWANNSATFGTLTGYEWATFELEHWDGAQYTGAGTTTLLSPGSDRMRIVMTGSPGISSTGGSLTIYCADINPEPRSQAVQIEVDAVNVNEPPVMSSFIAVVESLGEIRPTSYVSSLDKYIVFMNKDDTLATFKTTFVDPDGVMDYIDVAEKPSDAIITFSNSSSSIIETTTSISAASARSQPIYQDYHFEGFDTQGSSSGVKEFIIVWPTTTCNYGTYEPYYPGNPDEQCE